jgi:REP element-mobilizing transposase RayT
MQEASMARKRYFPTDQYPYHVSARAWNKEWFPLPIDQCWKIFSHYLYLITLTYQVRIHSFVLMDNHFHMLITTPQANLAEAMNYLMREVSKTINKQSGRINQVFGGPHHRTVIKSRLYYQHAYKYVYRNPIEAGLCQRVQDYPYSTLKGLLGLEQLTFPAFDNNDLITNAQAQLNWLNTPYPQVDFLEDIRAALKHDEFEFYADQTSRRMTPLQKQIF